MKKKFLIITLIDGRVIKRDISQEASIPIGEPVNSIVYAQICQQIAVAGYTDTEASDDTQYVHIAPSQIRSVKVKFE